MSSSNPAILVRCAPEELAAFNETAMRLFKVSQQKLAWACLFPVVDQWYRGRKFVIAQEARFRDVDGKCIFCRTFAKFNTQKDNPWPHSHDCPLTEMTGFIPGRLAKLTKLPQLGDE